MEVAPLSRLPKNIRFYSELSNHSNGLVEASIFAIERADLTLLDFFTAIFADITDEAWISPRRVDHTVIAFALQIVLFNRFEIAGAFK